MKVTEPWDLMRLGDRVLLDARHSLCAEVRQEPVDLVRIEARRRQVRVCSLELSVANIHPRAGPTAPPCPPNLLVLYAAASYR